MNFNYYLPVNLIFGRGKVSELGNVTAQYGKKALIVTGRNSTKKSGLLERSKEYLKNAGVACAVFDQVPSNPLTTTAMEAAQTAKRESCNVIIGIGGGSILDCAKAAAFLAVNDGNINEYIFGLQQSDKALPIVLVPTTCGTGSEGNGFAVLTNPENGDKKSLRCNAIVAKASIIDSECMMTMPKEVLASVGYDALCHCIEAYISKISQPLTDIMSLYGIELIGKHLVSAFLGNQSADTWDAISFASTLGGMVINTAGVALPHGMEHPASGLKNIVHGQGLAALTPVIMKESIAGNPEKFSVISKLLGGKDESDCVDALMRIQEKLQLTPKLGDLGIEEADIDWMVENCMKVAVGNIKNHPVIFDKESIREMYYKAL